MRGLAWVFLFACSGGGGTSPPDDDAGGGPPDAGVDAAPEPEGPAPPTPPALPSWRPCPDGWREIGGADEPATCDPWPASGQETCDGAEAHLPGEPGCRAIGSPCPEGEWSEAIPAGSDVLYVRAAGTPGGDGSADAPFGTIGEAIAAAGEGTVIALGRGTYDEAVVLPVGVTLWGACPAQTALSPAGDATDAAVLAQGNGMVRDLAVRGDRGGVRAESESVSVTLDGVLIDGVLGSGVLADAGGEIIGHEVVIRGVRPNDAGMFGRGIEVYGGARVELDRALVEDCSNLGAIAVEAGSEIVLSNAAILRTSSRASDGTFGDGLQVGLGAVARLQSVVFERNHDGSILVDGDGSHLEATGLVLRDTLPEEAGRHAGQALNVQNGATAEIHGAVLERSVQYAIGVREWGSSLSIDDAVVRDTASDAVLGGNGNGIMVETGAVLAAHRLLMERNRMVALGVWGSGSTATLEDIVIRDTRPQDIDDAFGLGVVVEASATLALTRGTIEQCREIAILARERGTSVNLQDLVVRDTLAYAGDDLFGRALHLGLGATGTLSRALLERNHEITVSLFDEGTRLDAEDVVVQDTLERECAADTCADAAAGIGIGVYDDATAEVQRFDVSGSPLCGVQLASGGALDLHQGDVFENTIGANVQTDGFDVTRLSDEVSYRDNERNFDAAALPVPTGAR